MAIATTAIRSALCMIADEMSHLLPCLLPDQFFLASQTLGFRAAHIASGVASDTDRAEVLLIFSRSALHYG